ncbi:hypothetical protein ACP4OV_014679 [Aristida adscensionis]
MPIADDTEAPNRHRHALALAAARDTQIMREARRPRQPSLDSPAMGVAVASHRHRTASRIRAGEGETATALMALLRVMFHRTGSRWDYFAGDSTTSSTSYTSTGERISASLELVDPPGTSILTVDWPEEPAGQRPIVVAAYGPAVLFRVVCSQKRDTCFLSNHFVYHLSSAPSEPPSLSRLPLLYEDCATSILRILAESATGILCTGQLFMVANLRPSKVSPSMIEMSLWVSGSDRWKVMDDLSVRGRSNLSGWSPAAVLAFRHRFFICVDYCMGIIFADILHPDKNRPCLWYVPLPVLAGPEEPNDWGYRPTDSTASRN